MENCYSCHESERCALVQTRAMKVKDWMKDTFSKWTNSIRRSTILGQGENLLDHNYQTRISMTMTIPKQVYDRWMGKFLMVEKIFRAVYILAALEMQRFQLLLSKEELRKDACGMILQSA